MKRLLPVLISIIAFQFSFAQWSANGTNVYYNNGHVGIGTSSPNTYWGRVLQVYDANSAALSVKTPQGDWQLVTDASGGLHFRNIQSGGNLGALFISSGGNFGISTISPRGQFDVAGSGDIYLSNSTTTGTTQSVYLPGHIYIAPYAGTNISYFQARRSDNSGSTELQIRTFSSGSLIDAMRINQYGNVGIGTTTPQAQLDVAGQLRLGKTGIGGLISFARPGDGNYQASAGWATDEVFRQYFSGGGSSYRIASYTGAGVTDFVTVTNNGNVAIGTTDPQGYKLAVNGDAIFTRVKVKTYATWPDYVFQHNYKLRPLKDLENYIRQNNHLPDVPSAGDVEKNGLDLGANQATLLKKIEEFTLYIIDQDKKNELQQKEINDLKAQNKELGEIKKELETIKAKLQN